jgi:hypothetical protein
MMRNLILFLSFFCFLSTGHAQFQRLVSPTAQVWTFFGESISMHGRYLIVGEPAVDAVTTISEKTHVYRLDYNGWKRIQTFVSSGSVVLETDLGGRTGMSENWLAFSQINNATSWKIHLYRKQADTFAFKQTLITSMPYGENAVCKTIALTDQHLIVGGKGSALCYRVNATTGLWELKQTITKTGTEFGHSAAIYENRAVICSNREDAAYAYEYIDTTWIQRKKLVPNNAVNHDFATNCAIHKDLITVTDFGFAYTSNFDTSKAYVFKWESNGNISQIAALKSPNNSAASNFGGSYYFLDDLLYVGSNADHNTGNVFKFKRVGDQFQYAAQYSSPDGGNLPVFGESMTGSGNQLLIGDPYYAINKGAVYHGFVYDSLYAYVDCQLPATINGNTVDTNNFYQIFQSDASAIAQGKPRKFGVMNVDLLFKNLDPVLVCQTTDTFPATSFDYTQGYKLEVPDGMYARWTTNFSHQGNHYSASDILDDTTSLMPKLKRLFPVEEINLQLQFGRAGQVPCKTYPLKIQMIKLECPMQIDTVTMTAGDTIMLLQSCTFYHNPMFRQHNWQEPQGGPNTFVTSYEPTTRVFPKSDLLYTYRMTHNEFGYRCVAEQRFFVDVNYIDVDGDGFPNLYDCNDLNAQVNPNILEIPFNGIDDDCQDGDDGFCVKRQPGADRGFDAMVQSDSLNINSGNHFDLNTAVHDSWVPVKKHNSFLKFDLTNIPADAVIDSAFLSLYWNPDDKHGVFGNGHFDGVNGAPMSQLILDRVTTTWSDATIKSSNTPSITSVNRVTIPHSAYPGGTSNFTRMRVTKLIADMINPALQGNNGLRLSILPQSNTRQFIFASSNHPNPSIRPKLELCWHRDSSVAVNEIYTGLPVLLYPNPASDQVVIQVPQLHVTQCIITNILGQVIKNIEIRKPETLISVRDWPIGQYRFVFEDGSTRILVKQ